MGALMITIEFGGILYYIENKEPVGLLSWELRVPALASKRFSEVQAPPATEGPFAAFCRLMPMAKEGLGLGELI